MRLSIFEFEDLPWLPEAVRDGMTDFLQFVLGVIDFYRPVSEYIKEVMQVTGHDSVVDLCSGGGGYAVQLQRQLSVATGKETVMVLTDKYPNVAKFRYLHMRSKGYIEGIETPVDATHVPEQLVGLRTMFSAAHHFEPDTLKLILQNTARSRSSIAIFDGGNKGIGMIFALLVFFPILFLLCTPFIKPFSWSRLVFTYLLPLIPLCTLWDGMASILRLYSVKDFAQMTDQLRLEGYQWKVGKIATKLGMKITYVVGHPI